jgi:hypothetical protein
MEEMLEGKNVVGRPSLDYLQQIMRDMLNYGLMKKKRRIGKNGKLQQTSPMAANKKKKKTKIIFKLTIIDMVPIE